MIRDVTADFVDRKKELALFRQMLTGETDKRILLVLEPGEKGKTYFILRLLYECEGQSVPVVLLDFDQRRSGLTDYLSVAREMRRYLSDECTPAICTCEKDIFGRDPVFQGGTGDSDGVDLGRRGRYDGAEITGIAGRDYVKINYAAGPPIAEQAARRMARMGRALQKDLAGLAGSHGRVVLMMDTFEHVGDETCAWLERWVFEPLRQELAHVVLVVGGRPECEEVFGRPRLWSSLVAPIQFDFFSDEDIRRYYSRRSLPVSDDEMTLLVDLARESPMEMAQLGDRIELRRRGTR